MKELDYYDFLDKALNLTRFAPFKLHPLFKQILEITHSLEKQKIKYRHKFKKHLLNNNPSISRKQIEMTKIKQIENKINSKMTQKQKKVEKLFNFIKEIHGEIFNSPGISNLPEITKPLKTTSCFVDTGFTRENPNKKEIVCVCKKPCYGIMVLCESDLCQVGWYHLNCTSLRKPQKTAWTCKMCSSGRIFK
ncbi:Chromatin modification-related protein YNG2 [Cucumispora dikerogammari]|nr:Chromatin modification-related protein YNG2 [Cucumispora dikerogammari]